MLPCQQRGVRGCPSHPSARGAEAGSWPQPSELSLGSDPRADWQPADWGAKQPARARQHPGCLARASEMEQGISAKSPRSEANILLFFFVHTGAQQWQQHCRGCDRVTHERL